jgi:membrane protein YqaA with SNARE-associated domain
MEKTVFNQKSNVVDPISLSAIGSSIGGIFNSVFGGIKDEKREDRALAYSAAANAQASNQRTALVFAVVLMAFVGLVIYIKKQ